MTRHIARRLIQSIPTIFGITLISYIIITLAPGGPAQFFVFNAGDQEMSDAQRERINERFGLNDPWPVRYVIWLTGNDWMFWRDQTIELTDAETGEVTEIPREVSYGIIRGDFGNSFSKNVPVIELIADRLPATIELGIATLLVSLFLGVPLGILAAIFHRSFFDNSTRIIAVVGNAIPNFWLGILLFLFFGRTLDIDWARGGRCDRIAASRAGCGSIPVHQRLEYLILPTAVLSFAGVAGYSRYMRTTMLETINSDYVRTARSKGLPSRTVWFKHASRNALIPLATFLGPAVVGVLGGAVVTEQIFSWPGLGLLIINAINARDYPVVMASVVITAILTVVAFIISDILYAVFDPRIRF